MLFLWLLISYSSACLKDAALQGELLTEKKDMESVGRPKQRLESSPSNESLASSGFQEEKSSSDGEEEEEDEEEEEGTYPFLFECRLWYFYSKLCIADVFFLHVSPS